MLRRSLNPSDPLGALRFNRRHVWRKALLPTVDARPAQGGLARQMAPGVR